MSLEKIINRLGHNSLFPLIWLLSVLGSARTGLIFTELREGAQSGGLTQPPPGQTSRVFHTMWRHAGFRWGGRRGGGTHSQMRSAQRRSCLGERVCCASLGRIFSLSVSLLLLLLFAALF